MESDLSLLEISGEDDSLLLQIPNDDVSSLTSTTISSTTTTNNNSIDFFLCSPLQFQRSRPPVAHAPPIVEGRIGSEDAEKPSLSSHVDSINKENINANKSEVPKLNMEPQQMKRKKKGGGYNLRKSLAWDRAFFTEEGVLNPFELSMISGNSSKSGGGMLSVIHEEGRESLSSVMESASDSADLQALEENLFKELPTTTPNKDRKSSRLMLKHGSPAKDNATPASSAKRKVLTTHDVSISGAKRSGCPRPVASSSLKRPANENTTKAAIKETKVSKVPAPKPDSRVLSRIKKGAIPGASDSKCNQIAQPAVNVQRNTGLKASSNNTRNVQSNPKAGPANKSLPVRTSVRQARRNVVSSASAKQSPTPLQHPPVAVANNGLEVIPDPLPSSTGHKSNGRDGGCSKIAVSIPQKARYTGGNKQHAPIQTAKPSGLRMPSPSLGFFGQPKASLRNPLQKSSQPSNLPESNVSNLRKPGALNPVLELRPPPAPGKIKSVVNDVTTMRNMKALCSGLEYSVPSTVNPVLELRPPPAPGKMNSVVNDVTTMGNMKALCSSLEYSVPSTVNSASQEKMKSVLQVNNMQKVEVKEPYDSKSYETTKNQQELHSILDHVDQQFLEHADPYKTENISHAEDIELQRNNNKYLLQRGPCEQLEISDGNKNVTDVCQRNRDSSGTGLENLPSMSCLSPGVQVKGVSGTNDMIEPQLTEDKSYNLAIKNNGAFSESLSGDASCYSTQSISKVNDDCLSSMHNVKEQSVKEAELMKPFTCKDDEISNEHQRLQARNGRFVKDSEPSEEFEKFNGVIDVSPKVQDHIENELEWSHDHGLSFSMHMEEAKDDASKDDRTNRKSLLGDAQVHSFDGDMSVETRKSSLSTSAMDNQHLMIVDDGNERFGEQPELSQAHSFDGDMSVETRKSSLSTSAMENQHLMVVDDGNDRFGEQPELSLVQSFDSDMSVETRKSSLSTSAKDNQHIMVVDDVNEILGEQPELSNPSLVREVFQDGRPHFNDCLLHVKSYSSEESQQENVLQSVDFVVLEGGGACVSESKSSSALCSIPPAMQDCGYDVVKTMEYQDVEDALSGSVESNLLVDTQFRHDMELHTLATSLELDMTGKYHITGNSCPESGDFIASELENPHLVSHLSPAVQVTGSSGINDMIEREDVEDKQCNFSLKNCDTKEHTEEQVKVIMPSPCEADKLSYEDKQIPVTYSLLFEESPSFEGSLKFNGSCASGLGSPHSLSQHKHIGQANKEADGTNNMFKESLVMQSLDGSSLVDICNSNASISGANNQYLMVVDDVNEQSGHPELQNFIVSVEQVSEDNNHEFCLNDDLLLANTTSGELKKENVFESVLEQSDVCGSESKSAKLFSQVTPTLHDSRLDVDQKDECLHMEDAMISSVNIEPPVENFECRSDAKHRHDNGLSCQASLEFDSSPKMSKDQISGAVTTCNSKAFCSLKSESLPEVADTDISLTIGTSDCEMQHELGNIMHATEDKDATVELTKSGNERKEDALVIKPPPDAVPFSAEWLAAFEAAGEVKRNNQGIGPFDCTKYTNTNIPPSSE